MRKRIALTSLLGILSLLSALCWFASDQGWTPPVQWAWRPLTQSLALGFAALMVTLLLRAIAISFHTGRFGWQQRLRTKLQIAEGKPIAELSWLVLTLDLTLLFVLPLALLQIWGLTETSMTLLKAFTTKGFKVGGLKVVPGRWLLAIAIFALLLTLTRWMKRKMETSWLEHTKMERGTREAAATVFGYASFVIAALIALNITGLKLTNLAMLASALSIGIGFGLQNIVNNFVSGLILLFERPIRRGDTVTVGNTTGIVRRISIRSTEIETGDRITVTVPNSDLISSQVQNWSLRDRCVRAVLPISVAYGSDTEKVKAVLLAVANAHPEVIKPGAFIPGPVVLFTSFGDSALNFELRLYVRDLDVRGQVVSDLNFAIDRSFRENHIEMPFPQRQVWVRNETGAPVPPDAIAAGAD